jgi:hypothetical protein
LRLEQRRQWVRTVRAIVALERLALARTDCPAGQVCCGAFDTQAGYQRTQCQATCNDSPVPGLAPVRFCDGNAPIDECVEIGKKCGASASLPGFHVCK